MKTSKRGKAIIGIALAAIMVASVMVAMIGSAGADTPVGRRYNVIEKDVVNTVLIGQDILFNPDVTWTPVPPVIVRYVFGDFADTYDSTEKDGHYYVFNVN